MKFSIIMPTYNDALSIEETLNSVLNQDYSNWELIISDDGSTDNTKQIIDKFIKKHNEKRIRYFYQSNQDQLNAIMNVMNKISGDYVYILHSDDLFADNEVLTKAKEYLMNKEVDAIISSPLVIDKNSITTGIQKVKKYKKIERIKALQLLWLGRNYYIDFAFHTKESFIENVKNNYLTWNFPFWLKIYEDKKPGMETIENVNFPFFKYRVFEGNYINNEIGKLNVINGELRTAVYLMKYYHIPCYKLQYYIFRIFNKLKLEYFPIYLKKETKNKEKIIDFIIKKRFLNFENNKFLDNLSSFYHNDNKRSITISKINSDDFIYYGKDMRRFNNDLLNNAISPIYKKILDEMKLGFNKIIVKSAKDKETMEIVTKFLCISPFVTIEIAS